MTVKVRYMEGGSCGADGSHHNPAPVRGIRRLLIMLVGTKTADQLDVIRDGQGNQGVQRRRVYLWRGWRYVATSRVWL